MLALQPTLSDICLSLVPNQADAFVVVCLVQLSDPAISESCPMPFDEGRLWKGENGEELKQQLQATFKNITRVMDCVGCEKCKLWGKLQTLGALTCVAPASCCCGCHELLLQHCFGMQFAC